MGESRAYGKFEYQHAFIQYAPAGQRGTADIPIDITEGLNAWGADGWEVVNMEAVWLWNQENEHRSWPETLRGYYVTFKRLTAANAAHDVVAEARAIVADEESSR